MNDEWNGDSSVRAEVLLGKEKKIIYEKIFIFSNPRGEKIYAVTLGTLEPSLTTS